VVGEEKALFVGSLDGGEEVAEEFGIIEIGRGIPDLIHDLGEGAAAQSVFALAKVEENQRGADLFKIGG